MLRQNKYEKVHFMSVDEALEINEESIKAKQAQMLMAFDISDFIEMHREDMYVLDDLEAHIHKRMSKYSKNGMEIESIEKAYAFKIDILLRMARRFHPLSGYGKKLLADATDCRMTYEKKIYPMVTAITRNNIGLFTTVISEDLCEDIVAGRRSAIGAIRTIKGRTYGAGALVYFLDEVPTYENGVLRIDWLFVNEKFRGRGISHFLIGELMAQAAKEGVENMAISFPAKSEYNLLLGYILGTWHFEFGTGINNDSVIKVGDIKSFNKLSGRKKGAKSLFSLDEKARTHIIKNSLLRFGYRGFLDDVPTAYFDPEMSFFFGSETKADAVLLAHRMPSGMLRVEFIGYEGSQQETKEILISTFLERVLYASNADDLLMIPVDTEETGEYLDELCPRQMGQYSVEGILEPPAAAINMDEKNINELLAASAERLNELRESIDVNGYGV